MPASFNTSFLGDFFYNLISESKHFFRQPGMVAITFTLLSLVLIFIVFPIGAVLIRSFSVSAPVVEVSYNNSVSKNPDSRKISTLEMIDAIKHVQGVEKIQSIINNRKSVIVVRFNKNWDDLRGAEDVESAIGKIKKGSASFVEEINIRLKREMIYSISTYVDFFSKAYYYRALRNSIILACSVTTIICFFAFILAYLSLNGPKFLRTPLKFFSLFPLIVPPFAFALSLILIGGRNGIITKLLHLPFNFYGWPGVITAMVISHLPLGFLIIENVLKSMSPNLEDVARDMGASDSEVLFKITIPLAAPGLFKAALLVFIISIANFGVPMIIGGGIPFLATDAYVLWVSENNVEMAAVFCVFLVLPCMLIFILQEFFLGKKKYTTIVGKPQQSEKKPISSKMFYPMAFIAGIFCLMVLLCFGIIFVGAFTKVYMVDNSFTLKHFDNPTGIRCIVNSLKLAFGAACITPIIGVTLSYILVRKRIPLKRVLEFLALLGFSVPGTVMGIAYIIFFNSPPLKLTGTFIILILNEAFRNLSVSLEAGVSKLHQVDVEIEEAAIDMGASGFQTLLRIVFPVISSALVAGFVYTFMVGMITLSSVIFLVSPGTNLASIYILSNAELGFLGTACALSVLLILAVVISLWALKLITKHTQIAI